MKTPERIRKYHQSPKGRAAHARARARYYASERGRAARARAAEERRMQRLMAAFYADFPAGYTGEEYRVFRLGLGLDWPPPPELLARQALDVAAGRVVLEPEASRSKDL